MNNIKACAIILAMEALKTRDPQNCRKYFEFKRRGNGYLEFKDMDKIEKQLLSIVSEQEIDNSEKHIR